MRVAAAAGLIVHFFKCGWKREVKWINANSQHLLYNVDVFSAHGVHYHLFADTQSYTIPRQSPPHALTRLSSASTISLHSSLHFCFSWTPRKQSSSGSAHVPVLRRSRPTCVFSSCGSAIDSVDVVRYLRVWLESTANWRWSIILARSLLLIVSTTFGVRRLRHLRNKVNQENMKQLWRRYWVVSTRPTAVSFLSGSPRRPLLIAPLQRLQNAAARGAPYSKNAKK